MRILHFVSSAKWTGAAVPAIQTAAAQREAGHEVFVVAVPGRSLEARARELGIEFEFGIPFQRSLNPFVKWRELRGVGETIRTLQPEVVHVHLTHDHSIVALALRNRKLPIVRSLHREGVGGPFKRWLLTRGTDAVAVASSEAASQMHRDYRFREPCIATFNAVIELDRFRRDDALGAAMRAKWNIPTDAPLAGIVTRLRPARGLEWLLAAARDVLAALPDAHLVICGAGTWKDQLLDRIARHPPRERIRHAGYVEGDDLVGAYNAFDVSILLKPGNDSGCRAAAEALACGTPVVGGDFGAVRDYLRGGEVGWLVPSDDRAALADAIRAALTDRAATASRAAACRLIAEERCTTARLVQVYDALYRSAIDAFRR